MMFPMPFPMSDPLTQHIYSLLEPHRDLLRVNIVRTLAGTQGQKRKRYEICSQCDKEYDVREDERGGPQCRWHEDELEVNYDADVWADHDEDCHGVIDTEEMRKEHPEGFTWACCEKEGTAEGCRLTKHEPAPPVKRVRA